MVVGQHHTAGPHIQGQLDHFARVHAGLAQRALEHGAVLQQVVLVVEQQQCKHLMAQMAQLQLQILLDAFGRIQHRALAQLLGQGAARQLQHRQQFGPFGRAPQAFEALQVLGLGLQQARNAAKLRQKLAGHVQHMPARGAGAQQQSQQLGVAQGGRPQGQQLFAGAHFGG